MILNINAPNSGVPNSIKYLLLDVKAQISPNTVRIDDFNTQFSPTNKPPSQIVNRERLESSAIIGQMNPTDI